MRVHQEMTRLLATVVRLWRKGKLSFSRYRWLSQALVV